MIHGQLMLDFGLTKKKHINHELQHPKPMRDPWEERYIYLDTYMKNHKNQLIKCIWSVSKNRNNPQIINSNRVFPHKPIHFGGPPLFLETPICIHGSVMGNFPVDLKNFNSNLAALDEFWTLDIWGEIKRIQQKTTLHTKTRGERCLFRA